MRRSLSLLGCVEGFSGSRVWAVSPKRLASDLGGEAAPGALHSAGHKPSHRPLVTGTEGQRKGPKWYSLRSFEMKCAWTNELRTAVDLA